VVFPTPPFWFTTAMVLGIRCQCSTGHTAPISRRLATTRLLGPGDPERIYPALPRATSVALEMQCSTFHTSRDAEAVALGGS
jgi:hypothetical protein